MLPVPLADVQRVEFFKRDELTSDLICCDVVVADGVRTLHEELPEWPEAVAQLATLPGFDNDWFAKVSQPPFEERRLVAFQRRAD